MKVPSRRNEKELTDSGALRVGPLSVSYSGFGDILSKYEVSLGSLTRGNGVPEVGESSNRSGTVIVEISSMVDGSSHSSCRQEEVVDNSKVETLAPTSVERTPSVEGVISGTVAARVAMRWCTGTSIR